MINRGGGPSDSKTQPAPKQFDADGALSREFLVARGHCCQEGCRNCPYGFSQDIQRSNPRNRDQL